MSIRNEVSCPIPLVEALGTRFDSRPHTVAKAETTGCAPACRRAVDSPPRGRLRSEVSHLVARRCALVGEPPNKIPSSRDENDSLPGDVSRIDQISIFAAFTMPNEDAGESASFLLGVR